MSCKHGTDGHCEPCEQEIDAAIDASIVDLARLAVSTPPAAEVEALTDAKYHELVEHVLSKHPSSELPMTCGEMLQVIQRFESVARASLAREVAAEKKAALWEGDARTAQANWHAACEDIAASLAREDKLREALRDVLLHCDLSTEGETEFERAVIRARAALAAPALPEGGK